MDRNQIRLGEGLPLFDRAYAALEAWKMFDIGWVELIHPAETVAPGQTVVVLAHTFGLYSLSASRVIAMIARMNGQIGAVVSATGPYGIMWNAARRDSAWNTTAKTARSGMTSWPFSVPSTPWPVLVTRSHVLPSGALRRIPKSAMVQRSPDRHWKQRAIFATLKV